MASDNQLQQQSFPDSADFSLHVFNQGFSNSIVHTAVKQACQVTLQAFTNPIDSEML
jgi:hypothetical protein